MEDYVIGIGEYHQTNSIALLQHAQQQPELIACELVACGPVEALLEEAQTLIRQSFCCIKIRMTHPLSLHPGYGRCAHLWQVLIT